MQQLQGKERAIYEYIIDVIRREGYSPSVRDIQKALQIKSTSTVHTYLAKLERKGYIQKEAGKSRTLRVESFTVEPKRTVRVPILGKIVPGVPILAMENHRGYLDFPVVSQGYNANELFALRMHGDSMVCAGILDGDLLIVKKDGDACGGDIVVALVGDEVAVRTLYREGGKCKLQPENPDMAPIILDDVYLLGRVVSVIRYY
ncbi:MAG: transcriptional repressor LexA [Eubacteriales bacterium]|nr:transcriptional repressor LexA [Clostridiales bacterium]